MQLFKSSRTRKIRVVSGSKALRCAAFCDTSTAKAIERV